MKVKAKYKDVVKCRLEDRNYDLRTHVQDRLGHDARYAIDPTKTVKGLGVLSGNSIYIEERKDHQMVFR